MSDKRRSAEDEGRPQAMTPAFEHRLRCAGPGARVRDYQCELVASAAEGSVGRHSALRAAIWPTVLMKFSCGSTERYLQGGISKGQSHQVPTHAERGE